MDKPESGARTRFLFDMMARLGYDAVTPGERELRTGLDTLKSLYAKHPHIQVVSANLHDKTGRDIFPHYAVIERGAIRFGVTGTTGAGYYASNLEQNLQASDDFTFEDSRDALRRIIPELRAECDVVVVLLHENLEEARQILAEIPGIDVAVAGNTPGVSQAPESIGGALFVRPGGRGQSVFRMPITVNGGAGGIADSGGALQLLDGHVRPDPDVDAVVSKWETDYKARNGIKPRRFPPKQKPVS